MNLKKWILTISLIITLTLICFHISDVNMTMKDWMLLLALEFEIQELIRK